MKNLLLIISLIFAQIIFAQNKTSIIGLVIDEKNQPLEAVNIYVADQPETGTSTDTKGYFELSLPEGQQKLILSYLGYKEKKLPLDVKKRQYFIIKLQPDQTQLNEIILTVKETTKKELQKLIGVKKLKIGEIKQVPMLFGEIDVLKAVQILPGVKAIGEGSAGFSVHGGSQDQNLILLDGAPVYHPSHILGFFSVFTPDIIHDLKLYKSSLPTRFGNRLASIMEVNTRTGNKVDYHFGGGIGMVAAQAYAEGPIVKQKSSFLVSARKSYGDLWLPLLKNDDFKNVKANFYDVNLKLDFKLSDHTGLKISGYNGRDRYQPYSSFNINYGNTVGSVILKHQFNDKLTGTTSLIYSNYNYQIAVNEKIDIDFYDFDIGLKIESPNIKQDFIYKLNNKSQLNFGIDAYYHMIRPGKIKNSRTTAEPITYPDRYASEIDFYAQHQWQIQPKFNLTYGLRLSRFSQLGPGNFYTYNELGETVDTLKVKKNQAVTTYYKWAPRLAANWQMNRKTALKLSYDRTYQFLHYLINDAATTTPTDLWLPSSLNLKPQISDAYNLELIRRINSKIFVSIGGYYRDIQNISDYKVGTTLTLAEDIESNLIQEKGKAYGFEFLLQKKTGKLTGSLAYTYSKSEKIHPEINEGNWYPSVVDRPHDVNFLVNYKISPRAQISAMWQYYSGRPITFPAGTYQIGPQVILFFSHRNANRLPDYHRLDLSFTLYNKKFKTIDGKSVRKKWQSYWNFSIYNAYGHDNTYMIRFKYDDVTKKIDAYQVTLFKIVPSISYHFKF